MKKRKRRISGYEAICKVALYTATHPDTSIRKISIDTKMSWETAKNCIKTLNSIGFMEYLEMKKWFWKGKGFSSSIFDKEND